MLEGSPAVIANFRKKSPDCRAEIIETYFESFESNEQFDIIVMGFVSSTLTIPPRFSRILGNF